MKVLITGINGFVGSHFVEYILKNHPQCEIHGAVRRRGDLANLRNVLGDITLNECDLTDSHSVDNLLNSGKFDMCFHLAGQSHVPTSWTRPIETMNINANGTTNLMESIRRYNPGCKLLVCGSSEEYGLVYESELPIRESSPLRPLSPYAASKVAEDLLGYVYFKSYDMHIIRTRAFNHTGPRRPEDFVLGKITKQAVEIQMGRRKYFELGNMDAKRDMTDVRDIVRAYWLLLEKGTAGEVYNICSNKAFSIREFLELVASVAKVPAEVKQDPRFLRPADVPLLLGDNTKVVKATGWTPNIDMSQTVQDMLDYWRKDIQERETALSAK